MKFKEWQLLLDHATHEPWVSIQNQLQYIFSQKGSKVILINLIRAKK
jgi:hypothetical protein